MSDYLVSLVSRSISQDHGFRFLDGELRPRLPSRFEPQHASGEAWPEPLPSFEAVTGPEAAGSNVPVLAAPLEQRDRAHRQPNHHPASRVDLVLSEPGLTPLEGEVTVPGAKAQATVRSGLSNQQPSRMLDAPQHEEGTVLSGEEYPRLSPLTRPRPGQESPVTNTALPESLSQPQPDRPPWAMEQVTQDVAGISGQTIVVEPLVSRGQPCDQEESLEPSPEMHERERPVEHRPFVRPQRSPAASPSASPVSVAHAIAQVKSILATTGNPSVRPAPEQRCQVLRGALDRLNEPGAEAEPRVVPTVNVTIGRVEVRAVPAPTPPASKPRPTPAMTLEEYLKRRAAGGGS